MRFNSKRSTVRTRRVVGLGLAATITLSGLAGGASTASAAPGDPSYPFWGRQSDLPAGTYYRVMGDHGGLPSLDFGATRWDASTNSWRDQSGTWADYSADPDNADWLVFDKPVFSPVSGKVLTCWRNHPENPKPMVNVGDDEVHEMRLPQPNRDGTATRKIIGAGNHVNVLTDDGHVVLLAHLKSGTVPAELCPFDAEFVYDADRKDGGEFPIEAIIPPADRPTIHQGQFVGRIGNTGRSSAPHLHIHRQQVTNAQVEPPTVSPLVPINYHGVFSGTQSGSGDGFANWQPLVDSPLLNQQLVYASPFIAESSIPGGNASESATALIPGVGTLTATRNENGNLEVSTESLSNGSVDLVEREEYGPASEIAITSTNDNEDFVVALRDSGGNLKLIGFHTKPGGFFSRTGSVSGGPVSQVAIAKAPQGVGPNNAVVTAVRDSGGKLTVTTWAVGDDASTFTEVASATGVAVSDVAIVPIQNGRPLSADSGLAFRGVVTVARDAQGLLRVDSWAVTAGFEITAKGQATSGAVSEVTAAAVRVDSGHDAVVAGMRDGSGNLRLKLVVADAAGKVTWHGTSIGGPIQDLTLAPSGQDVIAAMRDGDGRLRVMAFRTFRDGDVERHGEATMSVPVSHVSIASPVISGGQKYVMGTFGTSIIDMTLAWRYAM